LKGWTDGALGFFEDSCYNKNNSNNNNKMSSGGMGSVFDPKRHKPFNIV